MPFPTRGLPQVTLKDWPESSVALISTRDGVFVLDDNLNASAVSDGDLIRLTFLDFANGTNPGTGEMVLNDERGLYLAVDSLRSPEACRAGAAVMRTSAATAKINRMTSIPPARFGWKIVAEPTRPIGGNAQPAKTHAFFTSAAAATILGSASF